MCGLTKEKFFPKIRTKLRFWSVEVKNEPENDKKCRKSGGKKGV